MHEYHLGGGGGGGGRRLLFNLCNDLLEYSMGVWMQNILAYDEFNMFQLNFMRWSFGIENGSLNEKYIGLWWVQYVSTTLDIHTLLSGCICQNDINMGIINCHDF
jgi:hypothetical protein